MCVVTAKKIATSCTDDLDTPVSFYKRLKDFNGTLSNRAPVSPNFLLKEHALFNLTSYSTMDPFFEIYSQFDVVSISKELKHRENVF
jgi:hypothetical protein